MSDARDVECFIDNHAAVNRLRGEARDRLYRVKSIDVQSNPGGPAVVVWEPVDEDATTTPGA